MVKIIILFLLVVSHGNAKESPSFEITKIAATEEEIIIYGAQLENIEGVSLRSLNKEILKKYQVNNASGDKATAHAVDERPLPSNESLYLVFSKLDGEVSYPIAISSQGDKKVFYKISRKKKIKSPKNIEVDEKSTINFYPSQDYTGYDYDYTMLTNSLGDLVIKGFDKNLFKLDQFGNLEISGTLKVKGKSVEVPYAPYKNILRISDVVIGEDNSISGVTTFSSSGNMDVATGTFHVDSATGRVGIGNSTPTYKLDILGANNSGIRLKQPVAATNTDTAFFNGMVFEGPVQNNLFGIGYGVGDLFSINSFDGNNYRNIFSLNKLGDGVISGSLKIGAYTLPAVDGASGAVLNTNGAGVVSWASPPQSVPTDGGVANRILTSNGSNIPTWKNTLADIQYADFSTGTVAPYKEGRLFYNGDNRTLSYYNQSSGVTVDIGEELIFLARNNTGATIPDGKPVYITGATGNRPTIALAKADNAATSRVIGITTQDIGINGDGYVTMGGLVRKLDTTGFATGAILYLSDTTAGDYTINPPPIAVIVGRVITGGSNNQGIIGVSPAVAAGNIIGPASSTNFNLAAFNGASGKIILDSGIASTNVPLMESGAGALYRPIISGDSGKNLIAAPYSLPNIDGSSGETLITNGSGALTWGSVQTQVEDWQASTTYKQNDLVVRNQALIRAKQDYTSSSSVVEDVFSDLAEWISPSPLASGVLEGGAVTFGAGSTVNVTAGKGVISDYSNTLLPKFSYVSWSAGSNISLSDPTGYNTVYVDPTGQIGSVGGIQSFSFGDANIILAYVNPSVSEVASARTYTTDPVSQVKEFSTFLGMPKKGMNYSGKSDRTFQRSSGSIYSWGSNWGSDDPSTLNFGLESTVNFYYATRTAIGGSPTTIIDPDNYNPSGATLSGVPGGLPYTYQRIYQSITGKVALLYGQSTYKTQGEAINAIDAEAENIFVPSTLANTFRWVGTIVVNKGIYQSFAYLWKNCGYFGCGDAGVAGTGAGNGDVFGPTTSTTNRLAIYADDSGKILAESTFAPPPSTGTLGQVLTSNGDGTTKWGTLAVAPTRASLPSDKKLKKEIKNLPEGYIDRLMDLRPVSFVWKDTLNSDIGFIAQEVKKVFPEFVEEDAGYIGVNYQKLVVPLVKAVQEQQKEIQKYQDIIFKLEERIGKLEKESQKRL